MDTTLWAVILNAEIWSSPIFTGIVAAIASLSGVIVSNRLQKQNEIGEKRRQTFVHLNSTLSLMWCWVSTPHLFPEITPGQLLIQLSKDVSAFTAVFPDEVSDMMEKYLDNVMTTANKYGPTLIDNMKQFSDKTSELSKSNRPMWSHIRRLIQM